MTNNIYPLDKNEVERYNRHGIARVFIEKFSLDGERGCLIEGGGFEEPPRHVWIRRSPMYVKVVIASGKVENVPGDAVRIDSGRELEGVKIDAARANTANRDLINLCYNGRKV